jgi:hypothetical protein
MKKVIILLLLISSTIFAQQEAIIAVPVPAPTPTDSVLADTLGTPPPPAEPVLAPADTIAPVPADTIAPVPADTLAPVPADTLAPVPAGTLVPAPAEPIPVPPAPEPAIQQEQKPSLPNNTITVDFGPTIIGVAVGIAGTMLSEGEIDASGFGIGVQYERQIFRPLSLGLKFAYLEFGTSFVVEDTDEKLVEQDIGGGVLMEVPVTIDLRAELKAKLSSFSLESHLRLYPFGETFFLDGMFGYANIASAFSGDVIATVSFEITDPTGEIQSVKEKEIAQASLKVSRDYLKFGGKLGWRIDFGQPGGFVFEPALGFYVANALGKTLGKQLKDEFAKQGKEIDIDDFEDASKILEQFILVGGPRFTFAFGWRF